MGGVSGSPAPATPPTVVLTAHPLQRVGACALAALAGVADPADVTPVTFDAAVTRMTEDAVRAAQAGARGEDDFWLKASMAFFPNFKMNHLPTLRRRGRDEVTADVRHWRSAPRPGARPDVPCALCGRPAVGYFGKVDVVLAEAGLYRNTTPRGQEGLALCWPCVCCFHALPYGCRLTGGRSSTVHSWDDAFLRRAVARRVADNERHITLGVPVTTGVRHAGEVEALVRLRDYEEQIRVGVELYVFSNDNRGASLRVHAVDEPLAEWLRGVLGRPSRRPAALSLVAAHRPPGRADVSGWSELAWNAFHAPGRILAAAVGLLADRPWAPRAGRAVDAGLVSLCFSFVIEVMDVNDKDVEVVRALARNVALVIGQTTTASELQRYRVAHREPAALRAWLEKHAVRWALRPPAGADGPLVTTGQFRLLFDPDGQGWLYRQLLLVAVLERLHEQGWRPDDADELARDIEEEDETAAARDEAYVNGEVA